MGVLRSLAHVYGLRMASQPGRGRKEPASQPFLGGGALGSTKEVGHVFARQGITRKEASKIVKKILELYEKDIPNAPVGKSFRECYDIVRVKPTDEYLKLWEKGKKRLGELGLDFKLLFG